MTVTLPEIIYSSAKEPESRKVNQLLREGKIRKILPKAYTTNFDDEDSIIVRRHLFPLIARHYPEALLSHRSAIEYGPSPASNIYLTSSQNRVVSWPGITLKFAKGPEPLENDPPLVEGLRVSSLERAYLENLSTSRARDGESRTMPEGVIEEKLLLYLQKGGEKGLNAFRDNARQIASRLNMNRGFDVLNQKISALLSTKPADVLRSPMAMAQAFGEPYDPVRLNLFHQLAGLLRTELFETRTDRAQTASAFETFAFFESYFSNYIEGTTFEVEEAIDIVYKNKVIANRQGDTHDVKGTFQLCSSAFEMKQKASNPSEFLELLQTRHAVILAGRPDKDPGMFKEKANRAGNTSFVLPALVRGTLKVGFEALASIPTPLGRAMYMMFLVSEVHPFNDGNGRIARIMMNSELVAAGEQRILVPTVYRDDYLGALRKLTRQRIPTAYINMLDRIHAYSHWLDPSDFDRMLGQIRGSNALEESETGRLKWE